MKNVDIMNDASEIVHYDTPGIPLYIQEALLSWYPNFRALCHWHEDIEFIYIFKGHMDYYINGKHITIKENDGLLILPKQMHYGYSAAKKECFFACILIHPSIFFDNPKLYKAYIAPVVENNTIEFQYLSAQNPDENKMLSYVTQMISLKRSKPEAYEFDVVGLFYQLWAELFRTLSKTSFPSPVPVDSDVSIQRKMVSFIYQNYTHKLTLNDISASGGVCRSKCCQIFKKYLNHTPIEFLNLYRLEVSQYLLKQTDISITDIALSCGFNHLSYYSEIFRNCYGCTPKEYRIGCCMKP